MPISKRRHKSKKPQARKSRLKKIGTSYSCFDALFANPDQPMPAAIMDTYLLRLYGAVAELDGEMTTENWNFLVDIQNQMQTMVLLGVCADTDDLIVDANLALTAAERVWREEKKITFTLDQALAIRSLADDFVEVVKTISHRQMLQFHRITQARINKECQDPNREVVRIRTIEKVQNAGT